jgi:hypothetical protein
MRIIAAIGGLWGDSAGAQQKFNHRFRALSVTGMFALASHLRAVERSRDGTGLANHANFLIRIQLPVGIRRRAGPVDRCCSLSEAQRGHDIVPSLGFLLVEAWLATLLPNIRRLQD